MPLPKASDESIRVPNDLFFDHCGYFNKHLVDCAVQKEFGVIQDKLDTPRESHSNNNQFGEKLLSELRSC